MIFPETSRLHVHESVKTIQTDSDGLPQWQYFLLEIAVGPRSL